MLDGAHRDPGLSFSQGGCMKPLTEMLCEVFDSVLCEVFRRDAGMSD